ncbi:MAG TPA: hypothetical protein VFG04_30350 [Planctomycetaceae bacterium]|jgi:hypothetical protein|nr:hypothetical protein [Planctomycetaceae bacterium]
MPFDNEVDVLIAADALGEGQRLQVAAIAVRFHYGYIRLTFC